ncbi:MAG: RNA pseudouridine synthase [Verrucomicrobia bacterium]|nr:MAG: RNA pseudouridine synthase [Verrucomicrobiota bacterium]
MLVPFSWQKTNRNLQAAITSSIAAGDFWARSRGLKYLRFVHRLDAETSGVLLFAKSPGALQTYSQLFETRKMEKRYLAVVAGIPKQAEWICRLKLAPDPDRIGRMRADARKGKEAETHFRCLESRAGIPPARARSLVEARPFTGRTHQIRVHLASSGHPVLGDAMYGSGASKEGLALRAVELAYKDPFTRRQVLIVAPVDQFLYVHGFKGSGDAL